MDDSISRQTAIDAVKKLSIGETDATRLAMRIRDYLERLPSAQLATDTNVGNKLGTNLAEVGTDCISRQTAIDAMNAKLEDIKLRWRGKVKKGEIAMYLDMRGTIETLPSAQPEIIRCKDCKYWVPGYITDNDDFIPPKCGEWQQMVGHSSDDYCSFAERREQDG